MKRATSRLNGVSRTAWILVTGTLAGTAIFLATSFGPTGSNAIRGDDPVTATATPLTAFLANATSTSTNTATSTSTAVATATVDVSSIEGAVHPDNIASEQPVEPPSSVPATGSSRFVMPLASWVVVTDRFGAPRGNGLVHGGIDLALDGGWHTPVMASCSGTASTSYDSTYGYHVVVDCGGGWATLYAHLSEILVKNGQQVVQYGVLGISGSTGFSTGEHLHFEIHYNGVRMNPEWYLDFGIAAGTPLTYGNPVWYNAPGTGVGVNNGGGNSGGSGGSGGSGSGSSSATATNTAGATSTATPEPTNTATPVPPTSTPTNTPTATPTFTPTMTPTPLPPTPTRTPTPRPVIIG